MKLQVVVLLVCLAALAQCKPQKRNADNNGFFGGFGQDIDNFFNNTDAGSAFSSMEKTFHKAMNWTKVFFSGTNQDIDDIGLPNLSDLPANYTNTSSKVEEINGQKFITNTTVVKQTKDGVQGTFVSKITSGGGKGSSSLDSVISVESNNKNNPKKTINGDKPEEDSKSLTFKPKV